MEPGQYRSPAVRSAPRGRTASSRPMSWGTRERRLTVLSVLSVAFPFAPVGPDAVGGAEQVLSALDRALVAAGHRSIVVASKGSAIAGSLLPIPSPPPGDIDDEARAQGHAAVRERIAA